MAKTTLNTIKNWFKTGLKPTQLQFWAVFDSFFHKDEKIPVSSIELLQNYLNNKAEKEAFNIHLTDAAAHVGLFDLKVDEVEGLGLSEANYTAIEKEKLSKFDELHYSAPVNDLLELAAIPLAERATKQRRYVHSEGSDYFYDSTLAVGDLAPTDQIGGLGFWMRGANTPASIDDISEYPAHIFDGYTVYESDNSLTQPELCKMANGNILMVYRVSTKRTHQGNDGYLAGKISTDEGKTFGAEFEIYNDEYDDRGAIPKLLPDGKVVIVFSISNMISPSEYPLVSFSYITSADNGATWSVKTDITTVGSDFEVAYGNILTRGTSVVFTTSVQTATDNLVKLYTSTDSFATVPTSTTIITDATKTVAEPVIVDISGGRSIMITRNNTGVVGEKSFRQYNSTDGVNFTFKGMTNIQEDVNHSVQSLGSMIIDSQGRLIVVSPQREGFIPNEINSETYLRIYTQNPDDVFTSELAYKLKHEIIRPLPNLNPFYGYPSIIEVTDGIMVILCDRVYPNAYNSYNNFNELASIYTFMLHPVASALEVKSLGIEDIKSPIPNGYGLMDRLDYKTLSRISVTKNYFLEESKSFTRVSNLSNSNTIQESWTDYYLRCIANVTITLTSGIHSDWVEFEGYVDGNVTLTIVGDATMEINGVIGGTYTLTNKQFYKIKMTGTSSAVLTIGGGAALNKTGNVLSLSNTEGNNYNYAAPSTSLSYTTKELAINGFARCFINAPSEPVVYQTDGTTPAAQIGNGFVANTNMEMIVESPDGVNVEYYFISR